MPGFLNNNPVRVFLLGYRERSKDFVGEAKKMLFQLKNFQSLGNYNSVLKHQYPDGTRIKVITDLGGIDNVYIEAPYPKPSGWELVEEIRIETYVPIIELATSDQIAGGAYGDPPGPYAFIVYGLDSGNKDEFGNGGFGNIIASTTDIKEDQTPPGTYRIGYCEIRVDTEVIAGNEKVTTSDVIEELPRIDRSGNAYSGGPYLIWAKEWDELPIETCFIKDYLTYTPFPWPAGYFDDCDEYFWYSGITEEEFLSICDAPYDTPILGFGTFLSGICGTIGDLFRWWPPNFYLTLTGSPVTPQKEWVQSDEYDDAVGNAVGRVYDTNRTDVYNDTIWGILWDIQETRDTNVTPDGQEYMGTVYEFRGEGFDDYTVLGGFVPERTDDCYVYTGCKHPADYVELCTGWHKAEVPSRSAYLGYLFQEDLTGEQAALAAGRTPVIPEVIGTSECEVFWAEYTVPYLYHGAFNMEYNFSQKYIISNVSGVEYTMYRLPVKAYRINLGARDLLDYQQGYINTYAESTYSDFGIFSKAEPLAAEEKNTAYVHCSWLSIYQAEDWQGNDVKVDGKLVYGFTHNGKNYAKVISTADIPRKHGVIPEDLSSLKAESTLYGTGFMRAGLRTQIIKKYRREQ